jgi:hypothetical protein
MHLFGRKESHFFDSTAVENLIGDCRRTPIRRGLGRKYRSVRTDCAESNPIEVHHDAEDEDELMSIINRAARHHALAVGVKQFPRLGSGDETPSYFRRIISGQSALANQHHLLFSLRADIRNRSSLDSRADQ